MDMQAENSSAVETGFLVGVQSRTALVRHRDIVRPCSKSMSKGQADEQEDDNGG